MEVLGSDLNHTQSSANYIRTGVNSLPKARKSSSRAHATTPEQEEQYLISLATQMAEKQLLEGTASPSVLTHYLKLGTSREQLEQERLRRENVVLEAKAEAYASNARIEELFGEAINAFKSYSGQEPGND